MHINTYGALLIAVFTLGACDDDDATSTAPAANAEAAVQEQEQEQEQEQDVPDPEPEPQGEPTRLITSETLERAPGHPFRFRLTNHGEFATRRMQAWVYYYDAEGQAIDRYPHAFSASIAPGESADQELGRDEADFDEGAVSADVEISQITFAGEGGEWANENLVDSTRTRVPGGLSHEVLATLTGEPILGMWSGEYGPENKPMFTLRNTTDQPLEARVAWIYYYAEDGNDLGRDVVNMRNDAIAPGAEVPLEAGKVHDELPEGTHSIEIYVSRFERADGTEWENRNLYPNRGRAMRTPPPNE